MKRTRTFLILLAALGLSGCPDEDTADVIKGYAQQPTDSLAALAIQFDWRGTSARYGDLRKYPEKLLLVGSDAPVSVATPTQPNGLAHHRVEVSNQILKNTLDALMTHQGRAAPPTAQDVGVLVTLSDSMTLPVKTYQWFVPIDPPAVFAQALTDAAIGTDSFEALLNWEMTL